MKHCGISCVSWTFQVQATATKESIPAAKYTTKNNKRYTEQWFLLCLLLNIRSPSGYSFWRNNNILSLPCISNIRKCLSIHVKCGLDYRFSATFKKLATKDASQKHGILIFDEIHVRKDMRFNATTMSYTGHTDFGCEVKAPHQVADHGLVFTFHSFGESHPQPVVVCASHGPTKGTVLAQLIVKAILLLQDVGAYVDAIVCDDATTNRSVLKSLEIACCVPIAWRCPKKLLESCMWGSTCIFVFSGAAHFFKCVCNRLLKKKVFLCGWHLCFF